MGLIREGVTALENSPIVDIWRMGFVVPDVIGLWAGEPDMPTPPFICEAASKALFAGQTFYSPDRGIPEARQALVEYHQRLYGLDIPEHRITLTQSGMNAVMLVAQAMVQPGDNVVAVTPSWPNIMRAMQINGAAVREAPLSRGNEGWSLDLDRVFELCDERTRVIYTASPGNPTGWMMRREQGEALLAFARARNIGLLSRRGVSPHRVRRERGVLAAGDRAAGRSGVRGQQFLEILGDDGLAAGLDDFSGRAGAAVREADSVQHLGRAGVSAVWRDCGAARRRGFRVVFRRSVPQGA